MSKYVIRWGLLLCVWWASIGWAQKNPGYVAYVEHYKDIAIEQMLRYRIPASITLAQGLLESGAGKSTLCRRANNHFGIKCSGNWTGKYFVQDDDYKNEHFRVYKNAYESYEDHSKFLRGNPRYAFLFQLKITDYKGWAHGLKKAGYATNPRYGYLLIDLVERYELNRYDTQRGRGRNTSKENSITGISHRVYRENDNYYVIAQLGDTYETIAKEMGVSSRKLKKYNEVDNAYKLSVGDRVYMEKKNRYADRQYRNILHTVAPGESYYSIAQKYGMRIKYLYKLNKLSSEHSIRVGEQLRVR